MKVDDALDCEKQTPLVQQSLTSCTWAVCQMTSREVWGRECGVSETQARQWTDWI
jgi:hypothetical protein